MPVRVRSFAVLAALLLILASCTSDGGSTSPTTSTTSSTAEVISDAVASGGEPGDDETREETDVVPTAAWDDGTCPFDPPPGTDPECGTVVVPENWVNNEGQVELTVAVFRTQSSEPQPPLVYLEGGPGGHALDTLLFTWSNQWEELAAERDVIFFDQRGAGYSEPRLHCPEATELQRQFEDDPSISLDEAEGLILASLRECHGEFEGDGIDLTQYNTINNARDVEAIRVALEYDQWDLLGISYGTRLGLEIMRSFPEGVRSVVLDSTLPPDADVVRDSPSSFLASFDAVSAACDAEAACALEGNLKDRLVAVAAQLDANPVTVDIVDFVTGTQDTVQATGATVSSLVAIGLYSPFAFSDWPELLTDIESGDTESLSRYLSVQRTNEAFFSDAMLLAFQCNEEAPFADPAEVLAAGPADPFGIGDVAFESWNTGPLTFEICDAFPSGVAPDVANEPVRSDIPTMVMAGGFDPITPVSYGELAASNLTNAQLVVFPGDSHGVSPTLCGGKLVQEFLADPDNDVDDSCADDTTPIFLGADTTEVNMVPASVELLGGQAQLLQPDGWTNQNFNGIADSSRQNSTLDVLELIQVSGPDFLARQVEQNIGTQFGMELGDPLAVDIDDTTWQTRSDAARDLVFDWYERTVDDRVDFLLLISTPAERDRMVTEVLAPAAGAFQIG